MHNKKLAQLRLKRAMKSKTEKIIYCDHCNENPAVMTHYGLGLDLCSQNCVTAAANKRINDAELERQTEISSGGQH